MNQEDIFKKIIAHCKEYGFIFPSSEIYDGLSAPERCGIEKQHPEILVGFHGKVEREHRRN
ncbi:MAG: glycine--tRNA ligase [Bacteroidetes bacterium]|nr:glycine--tRNA ligase [Bacteroidota bacterium]